MDYILHSIYRVRVEFHAPLNNVLVVDQKRGISYGGSPCFCVASTPPGKDSSLLKSADECFWFSFSYCEYGFNESAQDSVANIVV